MTASFRADDSNRVESIGFTRKNRSAFTLVELMIAILLSAILIGSLTSVVLVSSKTLQLQESTVAKSSRSAVLINQIKSELKLALEFKISDADEVEFTVGDRDGDSLPEKIRYLWTAGGELKKKVTLSSSPGGATEVTIAEGVSIFSLDYLTRTVGNPIVDEPGETNSYLVHVNDDAPEGDGNRVLMVVSSPVSPNEHEAARKTQLEAWGFVVTLIGHTDPISTSGIEANHDLVYIVQSPDPIIWNDFFRNGTVGIVNEPAVIVEELGLGKFATDTNSRSRLDVSFPTHHVSQGLVQGSHEMFLQNTIVETIESASVEQAANLTAIVKDGEAPTVALLNPGDEPYASPSAWNVLGNTTILPIELPAPQTANKVYTMKVTTTAESTFTELSACIDVEGPTDLRFGLFDSNGSLPGDLIDQSAKITLSNVQEDYWLSAPLIVQQLLPPGDYYLAIAISDQVEIHVSDQPGGSYSYIPWNGDVGGGITPTTWPSPSSVQFGSISIKATTVESPMISSRRVQMAWDGDDYVDLSQDTKYLLERSLWWAGDTSPTDDADAFEVNGANDIDYFFQADTIPTNASGWAPNRIFVSMKGNSDLANAKVKFALHEADGNQDAAALIQETDWIAVGEWENEDYVWFEIPFDRIDWVNPADGLCLVITGNSASSWDARFKFDSTSAGGTGGGGTGAGGGGTGSGAGGTIPAGGGEVESAVPGDIDEAIPAGNAVPADNAIPGSLGPIGSNGLIGIDTLRSAEPLAKNNSEGGTQISGTQIGGTQIGETQIGGTELGGTGVGEVDPIGDIGGETDPLPPPVTIPTAPPEPLPLPTFDGPLRIYVFGHAQTTGDPEW